MPTVVSAIVLRAIAHGDRTLVLKAWTSHAGVRTYLVRAGGRSGGSLAALQPLNRVELVAEERADRDMHHARDIRVEEPYTALHADPVRSALALFVQELLYRVLRAESADGELDGAVRSALRALDTSTHLRWLPHLILLSLSGPLGFRPEQPEHGCDHFDLQEGAFVPAAARHGNLLAPPLSTGLAQLLEHEPGDDPGIAMGSAHRRELLDHLLLFFRLHLEHMGDMRSPSILHTVLA